MVSPTGLVDSCFRAYSHWPPFGNELSAPCVSGGVMVFAGGGADVPAVSVFSEAAGPELVGLDFGPAGLPPAPHAARAKVMDTARAIMAGPLVFFKVVLLLVAGIQ